jgi:hypothetical protein
MSALHDRAAVLLARLRIADERSTPTVDVGAEWLQQLGESQFANIPRALAAAEHGRVWEAIRYALEIGFTGALEQSYDQHRAAYHRLRLETPDVLRGQRVVAGAKRGGKGRAAPITNEDLTRRWQALRARAGSHMSDTSLAKKLSAALRKEGISISDRSIRRRIIERKKN